MMKCCGTCEYFHWAGEQEEFQCWNDNNPHEGEYREYWDAPYDKYKYEEEE